MSLFVDVSVVFAASLNISPVASPYVCVPLVVILAVYIVVLPVTVRFFETPVKVTESVVSFPKTALPITDNP